MSSTKSPGGKRAALPHVSDHTKSFAKDWVRLTHSGRFNMKQLKEAMLLLIANDSPLPPEWHDHQLVGEWADHRLSRFPFRGSKWAGLLGTLFYLRYRADILHPPQHAFTEHIE